jgi:tripartite-type tricarboxylate transporter receptor subunit TctC
MATGTNCRLHGRIIMELPRRRFLRLAAGAALMPSTSRFGWTQGYPRRPIRWVVGFPPGGSSDIVARILAPWLSERLGQQVIVENKPGAGTNLAAQSVINAPPDGHTLLFVTPVNAINATLYGGLTFSFLRDIAPVAGIVTVPFVMVVNPGVPAKTVAEFIVYAKANPGKISMGSAGVGSVPHMAGELFKLMTGVDMLHVPYRGSAPALTDLIAGHVQVMFDAMPASLPLIRSGALRALAVTTSARSSTLPDLATAAETVPGYETSSWYGIGAPKDTPSEIIERLNREIAAGLENPTTKGRLAEANAEPMSLTSVQFGKHIAAETEKWAKVVRAVGITAD